MAMGNADASISSTQVLRAGDQVSGLPMGVAEYRAYQAGLYDGPTRCVLRARNVWADSAECDIAFLAGNGEVRAELLGVSLVRRPAGAGG